jgi:hypothetical protein
MQPQTRHWLNDVIAQRAAIPFDIRKDAVIIGRGDHTRAKTWFDLNRVNLFYLNHSPAQWILDVYRQTPSQGEELIKKSIFSFISASHLKQLSPEIHGNILSWHGKFLSGIMVTNCLPVCADYLGSVMKERNIYMIGVDFDAPGRAFTAERDGLKIAIKKHGVPVNADYNGKNKYIFLNPNRYFKGYMTVAEVNRHLQALRENKTIIKESE